MSWFTPADNLGFLHGVQSSVSETITLSAETQYISVMQFSAISKYLLNYYLVHQYC